MRQIVIMNPNPSIIQYCFLGFKLKPRATGFNNNDTTDYFIPCLYVRGNYYANTSSKVQ